MKPALICGFLLPVMLCAIDISQEDKAPEREPQDAVSEETVQAPPIESLEQEGTMNSTKPKRKWIKRRNPAVPRARPQVHKKRAIHVADEISEECDIDPEEKVTSCGDRCSCSAG